MRENYCWVMLQLLLLRIQIKSTEDSRIRRVGIVSSDEDNAAVECNLYRSIK